MKRWWAFSLLLSAASGCATSSMEHWMVGQLELRSGNHQKAVERLTLSTQRDPTFAPAYLALAAAYTQLGDFHAVGENLDTYLRLNPQHAEAHLYLAECLVKLGDVPRAKQEFAAYLRKQEEPTLSTDEHVIYAYQRLANLAADEGDRFYQNLYGGIALVKESLRQDKLDSTGESKRRDLLIDAFDTLSAAKKENPNDKQVKRFLAITLEEIEKQHAKVAQRTRPPVSEKTHVARPTNPQPAMLGN